jgi:hypothetical protein
VAHKPSNRLGQAARALPDDAALASKKLWVEFKRLGGLNETNQKV